MSLSNVSVRNASPAVLKMSLRLQVCMSCILSRSDESVLILPVYKYDYCASITGSADSRNTSAQEQTYKSHGQMSRLFL